ncbi:hypothetical protein, conserved [Trypanosoma brucei gambiense DAL972]|uniref:Transmembrane protein n=1 Tax=Trypanosoma brucei gambiense (strain MHOM/CI/86/DAL972) TaxID=679716 RepID=D0A0K8_TRYB9|nr:hypothetical protein, conserved [Trypanosoma brucei gambiense DAL972]CBH16766.1 hypothetical protein, conserved [Trypanosoma brucei gambiense DAL972]|eukprot:XP_011779030.1 hypothetical protein, conserved [Trypanosoma brucei gambiense DAL972]
MKRMASFGLIALVGPLLFATMCASAAMAGAGSAAFPRRLKFGDVPVAPSPIEPMSSESRQYLIGIFSALFVSVAVILAVRALMMVDYSNDTLLMVEMPEPVANM